jgi:hypothetical protein
MSGARAGTQTRAHTQRHTHVNLHTACSVEPSPCCALKRQADAKAEKRRLELTEECSNIVEFENPRVFRP